jgi:hypothetical protein
MTNYDHYTLDDGSPLSEQEKWVLGQVNEGLVADVKKKFLEEEKYQLRSKFLEELITTGFNKFGLKISRLGIRIYNAIFPEPLNLRNSVVTNYISLTGCIFKESTIFRDSSFENHLLLNKTQFIGKVDFHRIKVAKNLFLRNAILRDLVDFTSADVGRQFSADKAKFSKKKNIIKFNGLRVGQNLFIRKVDFHGTANFNMAYISGEFNASGVRFLNEENAANFKFLIVGRNAVFNDAEVNGAIYFTKSKIEGQFHADKMLFKSDKIVNFNGMTVGDNAYFRESIFEGPVDFIGMEVAKQLSFNGAHFNYVDNVAKLGRIKIKDAAYFRGTIVNGKISFNGADLLAIFIENSIINELNMEHVIVERMLRIKKTVIGKLEALNLQVNGLTTLDNVVINKNADIRDSNFRILNLIRVTWPKPKENNWLEGLKYNSINTGSKSENWGILIDWIDGSRFNTQPYTQLEEFFNRCGLKELANKVFMSMKRRERKMAPEFSGRRIWNWFLDVSVGYGRQPWRALLASVFVVCLGFLVFWSSNDMVSKKSNFVECHVAKNEMAISQNVYDRFWYSIDLFLPIDLGVSKYWEPNHGRILVWHYSKIQMILGWVLVSILIAAAIGVIK